MYLPHVVLNLDDLLSSVDYNRSSSEEQHGLTDIFQNIQKESRYFCIFNKNIFQEYIFFSQSSKNDSTGQMHITLQLFKSFPVVYIIFNESECIYTKRSEIFL